MFDVLRTAASGMRAADLRLQAAARNIANANSVGSLPGAVGVSQTSQAYRPVEVVQSSGGGTGVVADIRERADPYVEAYSPTSPYADARGMVAKPNVDLASEMTDVVSATMSYQANALVMKTANNMFHALLDVIDSNHDDRRRRWYAIV